MGNRTYIRNLALSLMGQAKLDRDLLQSWMDFPPVVTPPKAVEGCCGRNLDALLRRMSPETLGRVAAYGRQDFAPHFPNSGTTLYKVLGEEGLSTRTWGGSLLHQIARATIVAEITDILLERLTPEQRARFDDDQLDEGIEPIRGRSVDLHSD